MTAFLDVAFTNAAAEDFVILPASGEWTGLDSALTQPTDGAASFPMAAGSFTSGLVLTGNDIILPGNANVAGLQVRLWVSSTTQAGLRAQYWLKDLTLGGLKVTVPGGGGVLAGPANWPNATPPSEAQELGALDSIEPFKALSLTQAKSNTRLDLQFVNPTASARTVYVWNAQLRLWLDLPSMQDVVERAYRKLAILSKDTTIEGDDLTYGLQSLNDMLFGWETYGVNIGHQERVAGEAFPIARKYVEATAMQLAERLGPDYQVPAMQAQRFFAALQRDYNAVAQPDVRDLDEDGVVSDDEADAAERSEFY